MSHTTHVSGVSDVPLRLTDRAKGLGERRLCRASSSPSRAVSLANPLADAHSGLLLPGSCACLSQRAWSTERRGSIDSPGLADSTFAIRLLPGPRPGGRRGFLRGWAG